MQTTSQLINGVMTVQVDGKAEERRVSHRVQDSKRGRNYPVPVTHPDEEVQYTVDGQCFILKGVMPD